MNNGFVITDIHSLVYGRHTGESRNPVTLQEEDKVAGFRVKPGMTEKKSLGFTLLEIMIALAIIGGLLVTLLYSLNYHFDIAEKHEFVTVATMLAKSKMIEIDQIPAATTGNFPDPYSGYHYETGVKDSSYPGVSELWVTVSKDKESVRLSELKEKK